jgi:Zn-dependent M28 family amino/carboxypeptidase
MPSAKTTLRAGVALLAIATGAGLTAVPASAGPAALPDGPALARQLVHEVSVTNTNRHLIALQRLADRNNRNRAAGTKGHTDSVDYVAGKLEAAGYSVERQAFPFMYDETRSASLTVGGAVIGSTPITAVRRMRYSASTPAAGVTSTLSVLPSDPTPGCEASDYAGAVGKVALVTRGVCSFAVKATAAAQGGALALLVYNNVPNLPLVGTFSQPVPGSAPAAGLSQAQGQQLATQDGAAVTLNLQGLTESRTSYNVFAETKTGRHDNVVMAGAHLDSVTDGPGINTDGTGSAALLETALQLGSSPKVNNAVRFAWFSAEELGQIGSRYYTQNLDFEHQLDIALYLNFDLIGSANAGYFTFDGDNSDGVGAPAGPYGSAQIEKAFTDYFSFTGVSIESTDLATNFDYGPFIQLGIPAGGLFTGADGVKTQAQADKWGGTAGVSFDPCFHMICDDLGNVDRVALDRNSHAMAFVLGSYAISTEGINGVPARAARAKTLAAAARTTKAAPDTHGLAAG